jgi:polyhydroxyalkanoate synthesis regulator phasin
MQDAWRAYLELAMGLTEAPRKRAQDAVRRVVGQGGATAGQIQALAEELVSTGLANREALTKLVRFEVDRALGAVGLATADEVAELTRRVHELDRQLREARATSAVAPPAAAPAEAAPSKAVAKKTAPSKVVAKKTAPSKVVAKKTVAKKAIAKKLPTAVSRTPAEESPATPARPAKKATGRKQAGGAAS